jgi:GT2 family glycosyltransferase
MDARTCSIVICSIDPAKYARVTALYRQLLADTSHEIIGIHDARSLCEGYNRGARQARGEIVVFSHDDVDIVSADLRGALTRALEQVDIVGVAGTSKLVNAFWPAAGHPWLHGWVSVPNTSGPGYIVHIYGVDGTISTGLQALDGMFFAVRREVLAAHPFDEATFDGFHGYDVDFTFGASGAGYRVGTTAEIALIHASTGVYPPAWNVYRDRFAAKYRARLPADSAIKPWSFARILVPEREDIVRQFPRERLEAITRHLRSRAAAGPSATPPAG